MSVYTVFKQKVEVHKPTVTTSVAGQKKSAFSLSKKVRCAFVPDKGYDGGYVRVKPTIEEQTQFVFIFPAGTDVNHNDHLINIQDRKGNIIDAGPFQIVELQKQPGFTGKLHHIWASARRVIET